MTIKAYPLAHLSDLHAGHEAYDAKTATGINVRGQDSVKAIHKAVKAVLEKDEPLVLISGDLFDKPNPNPNYVLALLNEVRALAGVRADGTRRQVVICDGNHDDHYDKRRTSVLQYLTVIEGVHVVSRGYKQIILDPAQNSKALGADEKLKDVVVHCLPHDSLKHLDEYEIYPLEGKSNILMTHGVAQGSKLFLQVRGREFAIPNELMLRGWDYVALGHWHKQGSVQLTGGKEGSPSVAWYAGSTENIGFGDLKGIGSSTEKGWLHVVVIPGQLPTVEPQKHKVRTMTRLPYVDAEGKDAEEVTRLIREQAKSTNLKGAIVLQQVINCRREVWNGVDRDACARAAGDALHYEVRRIQGKDKPGELENSTEQWDPARGLTTLVEQEVAKMPEKYRDEVMELVRDLVGKAMIAPEVGAQ